MPEGNGNASCLAKLPSCPASPPATFLGEEHLVLSVALILFVLFVVLFCFLLAVVFLLPSIVLAGR